MQRTDTIFALSSGQLPAGVAVVRVSGLATHSIVTQMCGALPVARIAKYGSIRDRDGLTIDHGLTLWFPGPASFTGEDCVEFHLHGGRAVVARLFAELRPFPRTRHAEPGEFTKRAFFNGKLDLAEAEALGDLINAETEAQRRFALSGAAGMQSALYEGWRKRIIHARAMIEAELDFADEGDVPGSVANMVWADVADLAAEIAAHVAGFHRAEMIRSGYQVVLLGAPNAGKSSLLNALARREVAIVSEEPGTTRDLIDVSLDLDGVKVVVTDTAGLREDAGRVEGLGIKRALARAAEADLAIVLRPADEGASQPAEPTLQNVIEVVSKADLASTKGSAGEVAVSAKTGAGIDRLISILRDKAMTGMGSQLDMLPARQRHVDLLIGARSSLGATLDENNALELRAEDLRKAGDFIGRISGRVDVEDLLDSIFSTFCVGK